MDKRKITKSTFIVNLIALGATIILSYLLIFKGIQLTSKPFKIILFLTLNISTIIGLYLSMTNKIKPLTTYYLIVILSPIVLTIGSVISGNGIVPLHFGGQVIFSTFDDDEKIFKKNNLYIKSSFSLMSNQWYDLFENGGVFEKKLGQFNAGEDFHFADFNIFDSINKKYIRLIDIKGTTQTEEFVNLRLGSCPHEPKSYK